MISFMLSSTGLIIFNEFCRRKFPTTYETCRMNLCLVAIFLYTQLQIYSRKAYKKLQITYPGFHETMESLEQNVKEKVKWFIPDEPVYVCEFIKDGNVTLKLTAEQIFHNKFTIPDEDSYDFFVFSDYEPTDSGNAYVSKIIQKNFKDFQFEDTGASNVKFVLVEITIGIDSGEDKTIPISFCNENYNYLRQTNVIDKNFMRYFMKKHYNQLIHDNDRHLLQNYSLKIIDDDIRINILDNTCKILILDNTYEIQTNDDFVNISNTNTNTNNNK